ncbi:MAG TPA: LPS export ABC transporter periplasmic protein LptC [Candidatus Baltobacteraceae bacterium]|nr:LPS export ABC transporter periplasmic protein LptC [Candidatus Baltobacteraceae bacterium]
MKVAARALLVCALLLAGCNPQPEHQPGATAAPSATPSGLPPLTITGRGTARRPVRVTGQRPGGGKSYELIARSYESRSMQNVTQATFAQTQVTFYDKDGTTLHAQAPQARLDDRRKQVILSGGVHAKTSTGLQLVCDTLVYDDATGMLHGSGDVRMTGTQGGEQQVLTGNSFTSDVKLTRMTMR